MAYVAAKVSCALDYLIGVPLLFEHILQLLYIWVTQIVVNFRYPTLVFFGKHAELGTMCQPLRLIIIIGVMFADCISDWLLLGHLMSHLHIILGIDG